MKNESTLFPFPTGPKPTMNTYQKAAKEKAQYMAVIHKKTEDNHRFLLQKAAILGVGIVHVFDTACAQGGLTIAFRKASPFHNGRMVDIAIATCSINDAFSKKIGTARALEAFFNGSAIQLPLANSKMSKYENLATTVKRAFSCLYYSI